MGSRPCYGSSSSAARCSSSTGSWPWSRSSSCPLFYVVGRSFSRLIKQASREKRRRVGSLSALAEEGIANAALVQALNRQDEELTRFRRENEGVVRAELASVRIRGLFTPIVDLIEILGVMVVFVLGTIAVANGDLTIGGMLIFVAYLSQLLDPVRELGSLANAIFRALAGAERVIELLDEKPRVTDRPGARRLGRARGALEVDMVELLLPGGVDRGAPRRHPARRPRRDGRPGRAERRRQVDAREAPAALRRSKPRRDPARRHRPAADHPGLAARQRLDPAPGIARPARQRAS